ncbi:MAG: UDP-N-acetylmuramoyl-L-alanine--D-glutamate ligase [Bacteroidota bacterium]
MEKRVTILGAGESGTGAALLAKAKGYTVFVSDYGQIKEEHKSTLKENSIEWEEGKHSMDIIKNSDLVIKSPGIPFTVPVVRELQGLGVEVIDELEFAFRHTNAKIIAITGTNGKTTTTLLTYHLLKEAGLNVGLAGNVGHSLAKQVIEDECDYYVVEISSFQLDGTVDFKPHIAILLNITPDHMDRYEYSLDKYADSKFSIVKNMDQGDHFIYYSGNELIDKEVGRRSIEATLYPVDLMRSNDLAAYFENGEMTFESSRQESIIIDQSETVLKGKHNAINMLMAIEAALLLEVTERDIRSGLKTFKNAAHRMEYVATINDVEFVNDSKATNVDAVKYALDSFSQPLVWIAGGVDKGNDYNLIMDSVNERVKTLVCLGKDNTRLRDAFHNQIINLLESDNMKDAVKSALEYSEAHDVVLLSPACASFDLFNNYEDRGDQFKRAVLELKAEFESKSISQ